MVNIIEITDLTAPELAVYTQLTQAQLRSRVAPERALFIAESPKVTGFGTALDAGVPACLVFDGAGEDHRPGQRPAGPLRRRPGLYGLIGPVWRP